MSGVDNVVESHGHLNIMFIFHMKLKEKKVNIQTKGVSFFITHLMFC